MRARKVLRVGVLELLADAQSRAWTDRLYAARVRKQFMSIMPQVVAVWCRELGHRVFYATYYGQDDPKRLLPDDLDVVFVSAYTQVSALAYALAKLYRMDGALTVIGGPHAKSFPSDCLRFFDIALNECDRALIEDILCGTVDPPAALTSGRLLTEFPTVEERMADIKTSAFRRGRPTMITVIPLLASVGCPYSCDFCVDWNRNYFAMPDRLAADLQYLSKHYPGVWTAYHDPNFAVRFDETMAVIETIPEGRRNPYIMESSLSILKKSRLDRLRRTNCAYAAPGVESWDDYSNKADVGAKSGRDKLEQVVDHFTRLRQFVPGLQANFLFGSDVDQGREPVELTIEFMRRLPFVWPGINIPTPFGGTPLYDRYLAEGRILLSMPIPLYFAPYLVTTVKNYHPLEYYDHLINIYRVMTSNKMLASRIVAKAQPIVRLVHSLRTFAMRQELAEMHRIRRMLATDASFRAFHEGRSDVVPEFYHRRLQERLGRYACLLSRADLVPVHEWPGASTDYGSARSADSMTSLTADRVAT